LNLGGGGRGGGVLRGGGRSEAVEGEAAATTAREAGVAGAFVAPSRSRRRGVRRAHIRTDIWIIQFE